ncbi:MAG: hypothetical protein HC767_02885 [Akkermansiaceae bacterium]|nr:hypothetical protein [Akkermansiaceae bacterium]
MLADTHVGEAACCLQQSWHFHFLVGMTRGLLRVSFFGLHVLAANFM